MFQLYIAIKTNQPQKKADQSIDVEFKIVP
jgi:hypothetical protein